MKGVVRMKNRVPFSWLDSFEVDKSLTVKRRVIVGDLAFVSKNYKQITSEEIRKIYQEALVLDLDDEDDFLSFISRNGLPYSDGLTYANLDMAGKPYEGIISDAIPAFGEGLDKFVDVEEMYKAAYGLWLLQKMLWIKYHLEELDKIDGDVTETTISELLINAVQILFTYDGSVFYSSFEHQLANNHSSTGAFIDHAIKSFDFSKPGIEEQALKRCLYAEELCSYKDGKLHYLNQGRVVVELFNEYCTSLLRILIMTMDIACKADKSLIQRVFCV